MQGAHPCGEHTMTRNDEIETRRRREGEHDIRVATRFETLHDAEVVAGREARKTMAIALIDREA